MRAMARTDYLAALDAVWYVENPIPEQILAVCPHLRREQVLVGLNEGDDNLLALPPVRVRDSYWQARYYFGNPENGVPPSFGFVGNCGRGPRLIGHESPGESRYGSVRFEIEAMHYAELHWPGDLVKDDWVDCLTIHIVDPSRLDTEPFSDISRLRLKTATLALNWNWCLPDYLTGAELSLRLDGAITLATLNRLEGQEIAAGHGGHIKYNCARCGGGLGEEICSGCGVRYPALSKSVTWHTPLPAKVADMLREAGHKFELPPERLPSN